MTALSGPAAGVVGARDVARAIKMHPEVTALLADKATASDLLRTMVVTAVIMGSPVEG